MDQFLFLESSTLFQDVGILNQTLRGPAMRGMVQSGGWVIFDRLVLCYSLVLGLCDFDGNCFATHHSSRTLS